MPNGTRQRAEALGLGVFTFAYIFLLLYAIDQGVASALTALFYVSTFTVGIIVLFFLTDRLQTRATKIDPQVVIATVGGSFLMLIFFNLPGVMAQITQIVPLALPQASWSNVAITVFYVGPVETVYQYIIARTVMEFLDHPKGWVVGIFASALGFGLLHFFKYGLGGAFIYVTVIGFFFLAFMRIPHALGSDVELSLIPAAVMHIVHNISISLGMSVLYIRLGIMTPVFTPTLRQKLSKWIEWAKTGKEPLRWWDFG